MAGPNAEVAPLGFAIDTATLQKAFVAAQNLTTALTKVGDAAEKTAKSETELNQATKTAVTKTEELGAVIQKITNTTTGATTKIVGLGAAITGGGPGALKPAIDAAITATTGLATTLGGSVLGSAVAIAAGALGGLATAYVGLATATYKAQENAALLEARLKNVYGSSTAARSAIGEIKRLADDAGVAVGAMADGFLRLARNNEAIGLTRREMADLTETVSKLGRISGATTGELSSGMLQFSQALAAGKLNGDELRSIMENMPALAKAIAEGLGVSVGQLRAMGAEGTLTGDKVVGALMKALPKVREEFKTLPQTAEQAFARAGNAWDAFLATLGKRLRSSEFIGMIGSGLTYAIEGATKLIETQSPEQRAEARRQTALDLERRADGVGAVGRLTGRDNVLRRAAELERLKAEAELPDGYLEDMKRANVADFRRQISDQTRAPYVRSQPIAQDLDDLATKVKKTTEELRTLETAYAAFEQRPDLFAPAEAERLAKYPQYLAAMRYELAQLMPVLQEYYRTTALEAEDISRFGAGGAASLGGEARDIRRRAAGAGQNVSDEEALAAVIDRRRQQTEKQAAATQLEVEAEKLLASALGRGATARIEAEASQKVFNLQMQLFGRELTPAAEAALKRYRDALIELAKAQKESADAQRLLNAQQDLAAARATAAAVAAGATPGQLRELQIRQERERKLREELGTNAGSGAGAAATGIEAGMAQVATAIRQLAPGAVMTSGIRGGNPSSQHYHGRAVDFALAGMTDAEKQELVAKILSGQGPFANVGGIGTYDSTGRVLHVDTRPGARAAWGPDRTSGSLDQTPEWFQSLVRPWMAGGGAGAGVGGTGRGTAVQAIDAETERARVEALTETQKRAREIARQTAESEELRGARTAAERAEIERRQAARRVGEDAVPERQGALQAAELARLREQDRSAVAQRVLALREEADSIDRELAAEGKLGIERQIQMAVVKETNRLKEQGVKPTEKETEAIREAVRVRELSSRRRAAAEEEAKAYENIWTTAANSIGNALDNAFRQFIDKRKVDVGNLAKSIATDIGSALIKATVTVPVTNFIKQLAGFAYGGTFANGHEVVAMANGRVLNRATYVPMADGRVAMMGESGEEAVMPLRRGADGKLGVHANGAGSGVTFQVFDQRSGSAAPVETRESRGPDGSRLVQVLIRDGVRSAIANGDVDSEMRGAFGVQRPVASR